MFLETARLRLRPVQAPDIPFLVQLWTDPDATRYMGGPRQAGALVAGFEAELRDPAPPAYDLWPAVERATGRLVGHCGLLDKEVEGRPEIELIYVFPPPAWGQGYATEIAGALKDYAFEQMGLQRLIALIDPANSASERVAVHIGLRREREIVRPGGAIRRLYAVERLRPEPALR